MSERGSPKLSVLTLDDFLELKAVYEVLASFKEAWTLLPPNNVLEVVIQRFDADIKRLVLDGDDLGATMTRELRSVAVCVMAFNEAYDKGLVTAKARVREFREQALHDDVVAEANKTVKNMIEVFNHQWYGDHDAEPN